MTWRESTDNSLLTLEELCESAAKGDNAFVREVSSGNVARLPFTSDVTEVTAPFLLATSEDAGLFVHWGPQAKRSELYTINVPLLERLTTRTNPVIEDRRFCCHPVPAQINIDVLGDIVEKCNGRAGGPPLRPL